MPAAETLTLQSMGEVGAEGTLWAGLRADGKGGLDVKVGAFDVGDGVIAKVAFASAYIGSKRSCDLSVCADDVPALVKALQSADADYRVLSLHSMDARTQAELANIGADAVKNNRIDVVYGSGPHVWKPVRVVERSDGSKGVVFQSLGNFLHPALAAQAKNYIGRALFDRDHKLAQVQLVSVRNVGDRAELSSAAASSVAANLAWKSMPKGVFANVK